MLKACLESIAALDLPGDMEVVVAVIDNTAERSAEHIVTGFQKAFPVPIHYDCEPRRGISMARNRTLEIARRNGADYVVFLDDDEQADRNWLTCLCGFAASTGGTHIIHGEVKPELPPDTAACLVQYFQGEQFQTGATMKTCPTNNVMIPMDMVRRLDLWFDERFGLTGGEDTFFFMEAVAKGANIFHCREAVVRETIPESKATLGWLSRRQIRNGIQYIEIEKLPKRMGPTLYRAISRFLRSGVAFLSGRTERAVQLWFKACASAGMFCGLIGITFNEYSKTHGY